LTDRELLLTAIAAAGLSQAGFAASVLDVDERTVRRWLAGDRALDPTVRKVCRAIIHVPGLAVLLAAY
jgi:DNA-binding transcriptional regulator YiaG